MRILILNDVAATVGGAETLTLDLRDEFRRRGHGARVLANLARLEQILVRVASRLRSRLLAPHRVEPYGGITLTPKGGAPARVESRTRA